MNKLLVTTVVVVGLCVRIRSLGSDPTSEITYFSTGQEQAASAEPPEPFVRVCGKCHDAARIIQGRRYREQWEETLDKMVAKGAKGSDEDFDAILAFLMTVFGRVNVNAAPADDIGAVLHLESAQADAIVRFREEHGKFADFDALSKVPGANVEALRKARDAIVF